MGEGVFGNIVKGPVHQLVDTVVNDPARRAAFLDGLNAAGSADQYCDLLVRFGLTSAQATYLRTWWYNQGPLGFWPWLQPVYPILRRSLIKAIEVANEDPALPLDSYWSPGGTQVHVFVTRSEHQVTRIILTPPTPPPTIVRQRDAPMWVVRRGSPSLKVGDATGPARDEVVESLDGNVITWRMRDF